jgi:hypothetical protein
VSLTVTVNEVRVPVLPCVSVALQAIVLAPSARFDPLGGAGDRHRSVDDVMCGASNVTGAPVGDVALDVRVAGHRHDRRGRVGHHGEGSGRGVVMCASLASCS